MTRVLIIQHEPWPGSLEVLDFYLSSHGFRVATARSLREAVFLAADQVPDVILCDTDGGEVLPGELLRALRGLPQLGEVPILSMGPFAAAEPFDGNLPQPCAPARVAEALRRSIRQARKTSASRLLAITAAMDNELQETG